MASPLVSSWIRIPGLPESAGLAVLTVVAPRRRVRREQPSARSREADQPGAATRNLDFQEALIRIQNNWLGLLCLPTNRSVALSSRAAFSPALVWPLSQGSREAGEDRR